MAREPILYISSGAKGYGKTFQTLQKIHEYVYRSPKKKVVVFDVNMEYTPDEIQEAGMNYQIRPIRVQDVPQFVRQKKIEAVRVIPKHGSGKDFSPKDKVTALGFILKKFRRGLVVAEDINRYLLDVQHDDEITGMLVSNRHRAQDIIINYQSLSALNTRIWQNMNLLRMHHQFDDVSRYKDRIPNYALIKIAQLIVNNRVMENGEKYYHLFCDQDRHRIFGSIKKDEMEKAIEEYAALNKTELNEAKSIEGDHKKAMERIKKKYRTFFSK